MKKITTTCIILLLAVTFSFAQVVEKVVTPVKAVIAQKVTPVKPVTAQTTTPVKPVVLQTATPVKPVAGQTDVFPAKKAATDSLTMKQNKTLAPDSSLGFLTGVIAQISFTNAYNSAYYVLAHYRPQLYLYDENNKMVAHWDISFNSQGPTNDADQMSFDVTFFMHIDNETTRNASFNKNGRFRIGFENFTNGGLDGGGADWIRVTRFTVTLQFSKPSFNGVLWDNDPNTTYNNTNYFSYMNFSCPIPRDCEILY